MQSPYCRTCALALFLTLCIVGAASPSKVASESTSARSSSFRLGSGALAAAVDRSSLPNVNLNYLPTPGVNFEPKPLFHQVRHANPYILGFVLLSLLLHMMPSMGNERNFNYRIPPAWSPENDQSYSFRAYMTDISLWIMLTDLQPHQQCAAIIMRLGGSAREMARMITPQEMTTGGVLNGIAVDPVTYLLGSLHAKYSQLEEESRLFAMTKMLAFVRRHGESINSVLARYEVVRQRAAIEGQFVMSSEGCSL